MFIQHCQHHGDWCTGDVTGIILCMCPANKKRHYNAAFSLIGWCIKKNNTWCKVVHEDGFQLPAPFQGREMLENSNTLFSYFLESNSARMSTPWWLMFWWCKIFHKERLQLQGWEMLEKSNILSYFLKTNSTGQGLNPRILWVINMPQGQNVLILCYTLIAVTLPQERWGKTMNKIVKDVIRK